MKAVEVLKPPTNVKGVRSFLGMVGFYRRFIQDFGQIGNPLHHLTRKGTIFRWTDECQAAFEQLKESLVSAPVMAFPDFTRPFRVYVDSSAKGIGAILAQMQANPDGREIERVIAYASHALRKGEQNYPAGKLEACGLYWAVKHFHPYLYGTKFEVFTDHNTLTYLDTMKAQSSLVARWALLLQSYDYEVKYRPGRNMSHVDELSRNNPLRGQSMESEDDALILGCYADDPLFGKEGQALLQWAKGEGPEPRWVAKTPIRMATLKVTPSRVLTKRGLVVVPPSAAPAVVESLHRNLGTGGHAGKERILSMCKHRIWTPELERVVEQVCRECISCQQGKTYHPRPRPSAPEPILTKYPWELLTVDIMGPFPTTMRGNRFVVTFVDAFSKFAVGIPTPNHTADTLAQLLTARIIHTFGVVPSNLLSDCGPELMSHTWQEVCRLLGIAVLHTSPYNPQCNGLNERIHRSLNDWIRASRGQVGDWDLRLPALVMAYNAGAQKTTGVSPHEVIFGRLPQLPAKMVIGGPVSQNPSPASIRWGLKQAADRVSANAGLTRRSIQPSLARRNPYHAGDAIFVALVPSTNAGAKWKPRWEGPYVVQRVLGPRAVTVRLRSGRIMVFNIRRIKQAFLPTNQALTEPREISDDPWSTQPAHPGDPSDGGPVPTTPSTPAPEIRRSQRVSIPPLRYMPESGTWERMSAIIDADLMNSITITTTTSPRQSAVVRLEQAPEMAGLREVRRLWQLYDRTVFRNWEACEPQARVKVTCQSNLDQVPEVLLGSQTGISDFESGDALSRHLQAEWVTICIEREPTAHRPVENFPSEVAEDIVFEAGRIVRGGSSARAQRGRMGQSVDYRGPERCVGDGAKEEPESYGFGELCATLTEAEKLDGIETESTSEQEILDALEDSDNSDIDNGTTDGLIETQAEIPSRPWVPLTELSGKPWRTQPRRRRRRTGSKKWCPLHGLYQQQW